MNAAFISTTQNQQIVSNGLVAYWSLNDGIGSIAREFGNQSNASYPALETANPPKWSVGKFGYCLDFDGTNSCSVQPDQSYLVPGTSDYSISYWFKTGMTTACSIVSKRATAAINFVQLSTGLGYIDSGGNSHAQGSIFAFQYISFNGVHTVKTTFNDNKWHHVVVLRTTNNFPAIYVDGISEALTIDSSAGNVNVNNLGYPWMLGTAGNGFFFSGSLEQVRLYNRQLTPGEILALYNAS